MSGKGGRLGISLFLRFVLWSCIRIRAKETLTVEMDHVIRIFGNPHLGLPGNMRQKGLHGAAGLKGGHENQPCLAVREQLLEFLASLAINRPCAGHRLDEQQPILCCLVDDHVRNLRCGIQCHSQRGQILRLKMDELVLRVTDVEH